MESIAFWGVTTPTQNIQFYESLKPPWCSWHSITKTNSSVRSWIAWKGRLQITFDTKYSKYISLSELLFFSRVWAEASSDGALQTLLHRDLCSYADGQTLHNIGHIGSYWVCVEVKWVVLQKSHILRVKWGFRNVFHWPKHTPTHWATLWIPA